MSYDVPLLDVPSKDVEFFCAEHTVRLELDGSEQLDGSVYVLKRVLQLLRRGLALALVASKDRLLIGLKGGQRILMAVAQNAVRSLFPVLVLELSSQTDLQFDQLDLTLEVDHHIGCSAVRAEEANREDSVTAAA